MVRILIIGLAALVLLTGCGSFWEDQGTAAVNNSNARRASALAAQRDAEAAIIEAKATGAMAESQARALEQSVGAVVDLADDGDTVLLMAGVMLAGFLFAGWAVWQMARRPAAPRYEHAPQPRQIATITDDDDRPIFRIEQAEYESTAEFLLRLQLLAAQAAQREQALIEAPKR